MPKKAERPKLRLDVLPTSPRKSISLFVPVIAYDEELDVFYVEPHSALTATVKTLPPNFHTKQLMDVDPSDPASLHAFQTSWGLVTSPTRYPLRVNRLGVMSNAIVEIPVGKEVNGRMVPASDEEQFEAGLDLMDKLDAKHPGFKSATVLTMTLTNVPHHYPFAPRAEVAKAIEFMQADVKRLTDAAKEYDNWEGIEERTLETRIDDIESWLSPYFPRFRMHRGADADGWRKLPATLPLSIAVYAQMISYLASEGSYKTCPVCGKTFMYKALADGRTGARNDSTYCSDDCYSRHRSRKQGEKRKKARKDRREAAKAASEEGR